MGGGEGSAMLLHTLDRILVHCEAVSLVCRAHGVERTLLKGHVVVLL